MRHSGKTFWEKRKLLLDLQEEWGSEPRDEEGRKKLKIAAKDVTADMVCSYLEKQARERSNNCANRDRKNLLSLWNWAQKRFDITVNPVAKTEKLRHDRKVQYTPSEQEVLKLLAAAGPEDKIMLNCYLQTGARRSEIFRWTWADDINFEKRQVRLGTRKTKDGSMSYEWLPMSDDLYDDLMWLWKNRKVKTAQHVFVSLQKNIHFGKPFTTRRTFMRDLCKKAGVNHFGFHALRRYVASILADKHKLSAKTIQKLLRHKAVTTTERYIQGIHNDLSAVVNLLNTSNGILPPDLPLNDKEVNPLSS